jgi:tetratricopeptide (TPR) repeat protein
LRKFAEREAEFVDMFARLIELSQARTEWTAVTRYADRLLAVNPLIALPYRAMAEAAVALGQNDPAIHASQQMLLLDPPDPADTHFQLARLLHARGNSASEARRHVLQALEEAPRFREAQRLLLQLAGSAPEPPPQPTPTPQRK